MNTVFSLRHKVALDKNVLKVSLDSHCRISIKRVLCKYSHWDNDFQYYDEFDAIKEELKTAYGQNELKTYRGGKLVPTESVEDVIESAFPPLVLDVVEAWLNINTKNARVVEKELNERLLAHRCPWRFFFGEANLIDSQYLDCEVRAKLCNYLRDNGITGALDEFNEAVQDLTANSTKDAVVNAHKSVESVMKAVLNEQQGTYGQLLTKLIDSGIVPEYYDEFLKHFEKLALGAVKERNLPARAHGQGKDTTQVQHELAEFAVNLAGSLNLFIIQRWLDREPEDIPF